jgi:hypothetical protein
MARTDVSETVERIRRQLNSTVRLEINVLGGSINTTDTTLSFSYDIPNSLRTGAVISIGNELMRVVNTSTAANTADVIRGWQDSDAAAHSLGDEVQINPRFSPMDIFDGIIQEIDSWEPDLFYVMDVTFSTTDSTQGVEIPTANLDAIGVTYVRRNWDEDDSAVWPEYSYVLHRGRPGSISPVEASGLFIRFTDQLGYAYDGDVIAGLAMPYSTETLTMATDLADLNVNRSMLELIEMGVKGRLMADDEIGHSARNAQDEPRRNQDVQPGEALSVAQQMLQRYERRRNIEVRRLRTRYPFQAW